MIAAEPVCIFTRYLFLACALRYILASEGCILAD